MKQIQALIAAVIVTGIIAAGMFFVGASALENQNTIPVADSPSVDAASSNPASVDPSQVNQLQNLVSQYQDRERQYQAKLDNAITQLNQANAQIQQANAQIQQAQALLQELQRRGVIRILQDGTIQIGRGRFDRNDN